MFVHTAIASICIHIYASSACIWHKIILKKIIIKHIRQYIIIKVNFTQNVLMMKKLKASFWMWEDKKSDDEKETNCREYKCKVKSNLSKTIHQILYVS